MMSKKSKRDRKRSRQGPQTARPENTISPAVKTVQEMVRDGDLQADPTGTVDRRVLYDIDGNEIPMGVTDPNIIGPDDAPVFEFRPPDAYPQLPEAVKRAEHQYVLPMAKFVADTIGITVIDNHAYDRVLPALQSSSLFVVLNLHKAFVQDGVASWFGLVLMCRRHPVVLVQFREKISTEQIGISQLRCWYAKGQRYVVWGDREGRQFLPREEVSAKILNYLNQEGILPNI